MPRKIRDLKEDLRKAGFTENTKRGKGSHTMWKHPLVPGALPLSGHNSDDANEYQEKQVRAFIRRAESATRDAQQGRPS